MKELPRSSGCANEASTSRCTTTVDVDPERVDPGGLNPEFIRWVHSAQHDRVEAYGGVSLAEPEWWSRSSAKETPTCKAFG